MVRGFEGLEPIFGEANAQNGSHQFLFHVHPLDASRIRIHVTDFHSHTWEAVRSVQQFEDLRDNIGIGGSWSEFLDYFISSLKSDTVKLVVVKKRPRETINNHISEAGSSDETIARLTAHKSKGMPLLSIPLERLMDSSANDAMSNLSLELFKAFKNRCNVTIKAEDGSLDKLSKKLSTEQEKDECIQNKPDVSPVSKKQKIPKFDLSDKVLHAGKKFDSVSVSAMDNSLEINHAEKQFIPDSSPSKVSQRRIAPAYHRAKVRGAILDDTENSN
ncbi:hypothetical protein Sjap_018376 [Stephania japonica]|uniref:Uncharacterized protein n=1 Tax=Stephania japonica TaxID=461633 RepID=A0AAP0I7V1_9MAGN